MSNLTVIANDMVPVYESDKAERVVNARELHSFLNVGKDFSTWIKDRIEKYGLVENSDYRLFPKIGEQKGRGGHNKIDYFLSLDTAKEIAMVENNEQGRKVRQYFIAIEKKAREMFQVPKSLPEALRLAAELAEKIEANKPKVLFADKCLKSGDSILIRELAKIACDNGLDIGEKRLFAKLREWGLLMPNNEPYQVYVGRGYFEVIQRCYDNGFETRLTNTTKVLPRGQQYIIDRLAHAN